VRSGFALLAGWAVYSSLGQPGAGTLRVEIENQTTGQTVPAMVCITSVIDNSWRAPPDGQVAKPFSTVRDFHNILPWKPGDIGPVRLTTGDFKDNNKRLNNYAGLPAYPFWREPRHPDRRSSRPKSRQAPIAVRHPRHGKPVDRRSRHCIQRRGSAHFSRVRVGRS
jgi:hypothetical protein